MNTIKTIFFDIGNVLLYFDYGRLYHQIASLLDLLPAEIEQEVMTHGLGFSYEKGEITTEELYHHFLKLSKITPPYEQFEKAIADIFTPNPSLYPIVKKLKSQGIRLILLSNTCEAHFNHIKRQYRFVDDFDEAILSYKIKARKPDLTIFNAALNVSGCSSHECFYTDDIPEYIDAARQCGIDAEVFKDTTTLQKHLKKRNVL